MLASKSEGSGLKILLASHASNKLCVGHMRVKIAKIVFELVLFRKK